MMINWSDLNPCTLPAREAEILRLLMTGGQTVWSHRTSVCPKPP
jgi:hypothetical protein